MTPCCSVIYWNVYMEWCQTMFSGIALRGHVNRHSWIVLDNLDSKYSHYTLRASLKCVFLGKFLGKSWHKHLTFGWFWKSDTCWNWTTRHILPWSDQSQNVALHDRDLTIRFAAHEPCARFTYHLYLRLLYLLRKTRKFSPRIPT